MRRSGRPNVVACLTGAALRLLAAVELPAFLFCAVRLAMPFARLPDHGQPTTRPAYESNHHFRVISHGLFPSTYVRQPSRLSWQTGFQSANRTDSSRGEPVV